MSVSLCLLSLSLSVSLSVYLSLSVSLCLSLSVCLSACFCLSNIFLFAHWGISDAGEKHVFRETTHAPASILRWSDPDWRELQRICSVFLSFSRAKWGALTFYGCSDEQCSTPRARSVWCWGGGWGGIITNVVVVFKKNVKHSRKWGVALHPSAFL